MLFNLAHGAAIVKFLIVTGIKKVSQLIVITLAHFAVKMKTLKRVEDLLVAIVVVRRKGISNLGNVKPLFERRKNGNINSKGIKAVAF